MERLTSCDGGNAAASAAGAAAGPVFTLLSEEVVHQRYLTFFNRRIQFPTAEDGQPVR
jgi:hypothetical protein